MNLINENFDITMTEIKKIQSDINELKASLEHTDAVLEEKVAKAEKKVEKLQQQINELHDYQVDLERLKLTERKIVDLEDWSRRNNLCIDGIREKVNKTWDECEQGVQSQTGQIGYRTSTPNKEKRVQWESWKIQNNSTWIL